MESKLYPVPSIGRIVHYFSYGSADGTTFAPCIPRAAIITDVKDSNDPRSDVSLCCINPTGFFFHLDCPYAEEPKAGHWNWPQFVPPLPLLIGEQ